MNESFHRKCGQLQDLHFNLVCRLSRKLISAASISLLFICTDSTLANFVGVLWTLAKALRVFWAFYRAGSYDVTFSLRKGFRLKILGSLRSTSQLQRRRHKICILNWQKQKFCTPFTYFFLFPCISFKFSANLRREMTISQVLHRTWTLANLNILF